MEKETITKLNRTFEEYAYEQDGVEYWLARELQELLDYTQWRNFLNVIDKAKIACKTAGNDVSDHFADVSKTIPMPKGAEKQIDDLLRPLISLFISGFIYLNKSLWVPVLNNMISFSESFIFHIKSQSGLI